MFIVGTYLGIGSALFSGLVCWQCFSWRRRFRSSKFTLYGFLSLLALLWSAMATITETALMSGESLNRTLIAWQAAGTEPATTTLDEFRRRITARNNSMIVTNIMLSSVVTVFVGLLAVARFGLLVSSERDKASVEVTGVEPRVARD